MRSWAARTGWRHVIVAAAALMVWPTMSMAEPVADLSAARGHDSHHRDALAGAKRVGAQVGREIRAAQGAQELGWVAGRTVAVQEGASLAGDTAGTNAGAAAARGSAPAGPVGRTASQRALRQFKGRWGGHTRSLLITSTGRAKEVVYSGCCQHVLDVTFRIFGARRSGGGVVARARILSVDLFDTEGMTSVPKRGDTGRITLKHGVIREPFVGTNYCNKAAGLRGTCGA